MDKEKLSWSDIRHIHFLCEKAIGHYATEEEMYKAVLEKVKEELATFRP